MNYGDVAHTTGFCIINKISTWSSVGGREKMAVLRRQGAGGGERMGMAGDWGTTGCSQCGGEGDLSSVCSPLSQVLSFWARTVSLLLYPFLPYF